MRSISVVSIATLAFSTFAAANEPTFPCHPRPTHFVYKEPPPPKKCYLPKCIPTPTPIACPLLLRIITVPCACPTKPVTRTRCPPCKTPCPPNFILTHGEQNCGYGY